MPRDNRWTLAVAAILLGVATGLGAWAAHGLEALVGPEALATFKTGVEYHFYHGLGLLSASLLGERRPGSRALRLGAWLFLAGIVLFSGSLYALAFGAPATFGFAAPIGGLSFIAGWACLAVGALTSK